MSSKSVPAALPPDSEVLSAQTGKRAAKDRLPTLQGAPPDREGFEARIANFQLPPAKRSRGSKAEGAKMDDGDTQGGGITETIGTVSDVSPLLDLASAYDPKNPSNEENRPNFDVLAGTTGKNSEGLVGHKNGQNQIAPTPRLVKSRRLSLLNFKKSPPESSHKEIGFEEGWTQLKAAITAIVEKKSQSTSQETLYQTVVSLCKREFALALYDKLKESVLHHLGDELRVLKDISDSMEQFLQHLNSLWLLHCQQMISIRSVFLYMDRTYVLHNSKKLSIWDLGLELFRDEIVCNSAVKKRGLNGILDMIQVERAGEQTFEKEFLATTRTLYEAEGRNLTQNLEVPMYLHHVKRRLEEETARIDFYLDYTTRPQLIKIVEKCLIADHLDVLIEKGLDSMLNENKCDDLTLMYKLFARTDQGLTRVKNAFSNYIKRIGKALVLDKDRDKTLVSDLLAMKKQLDHIVSNCFESNEKFVQAEKDAFDYFVNTRANKPAELVAKYMDSKLRSGNKEATDEELETLMDEVIVIFRFIQGKDVFEAFYKKDLAKRLLLGRSASVDAEKSMLSKLKQECGAAFTTKLEGMFKDMELSKDLNTAFKQYLEHGGDDRELKLSSKPFDFSVNVLTMGNWPSYEHMEVILPAELAEYQELFKKFYLSKHNGRKLQWQHSLSQFLLRAQFGNRAVKELQVSMYQALVLLLFNQKDNLSFEEIKTHTNIEEGELTRTMQSLACGKWRILIKTPRSKDVCSGDQFEFNDEFNEKLYRIRISQVLMKETEVEHAKVEEEIYQDRQYQIDAAIVRIMKTRKSLAHQLLISEIYNQLRFPVKPVELKKRIESLIEREYMSRDKDDSNVYTYLA